MDSYAPPHDDGAERCVLGAMLLDAQAAQRGSELLTAEDFYRPAHTAIFDRIARAVILREPTDAAAIATRLGAFLPRVGGAPYLYDLIACVDNPASVGWHARTVGQRAQMRRLIEAGQRIAQLGHDTERDPGEAAAMAAKFLSEATHTRGGSDPVAWRDVIEPAIASIDRASRSGATPGLSTGLALLDKMLGGLRGGQLIVVAGRPAMGKSVQAVEWARLAALHSRRPALIFSLEMGRNELYNRIISAETAVSLARITRGHLSVDDWAELSTRSAETESAPLYIDDSAPLRLGDIVAKSRRQHARTPLALIVVDYLQLVTIGGRTDSREREVSEISRTFKLLAKEIDVPLVAVAQLNRNVEQRADKRPVLSDLRASGSVEQDADIVVMLYRDDYYHAESKRPRELDLIVAKHRAGPQGTVVAVTDFAHGRTLDPNPLGTP